jgi:hypothetical protein
MRKFFLFLIVLLAIFSGPPVSAGLIRQLSWDDLIPSHLSGENPLADLTQDQQDMAYWVINMLATLPKRGPQTEEFYEEVDEAMPMLEKAGIDIVAIMTKRKEIRTAVVEKLNGQNVRIPGYLLPLEAAGGKVTEFLLVPYVGACIHVPPPPPNQIVHVQVIQIGGHNSGKLFDPVWVIGKMTVKSMAKELYLLDGSADIDIGYAMHATQIKPYQE